MTTEFVTSRGALPGVVLALAWSSRQFLAFAARQPTLAGEVALAVAVGCVCSIGVLLWWSGRYSA